MSRKVIRIWDGCKVIGFVDVSGDAISVVTRAGGAANSTLVDIEIDPFAGLIVDHETNNPPKYWREAEE